MHANKKRNKSIAILVQNYCPWNGMDRVAQTQAEDFIKKGNRVTIYTLKASMNPKGYNVVELGMPKIRALGQIYKLFFFIDVVKVWKAVQMMKGHDEMYAHYYPMTLISSLARKLQGIRYVYYNHAIVTPSLYKRKAVYINILKILTNLTIKNADFAISVSKFAKNALKRDSGLESIVRYNKVDKKKYNKRLNKRIIAAIIRKHGLKRPIILYVGSSLPHKGIPLLINAFRIVKEKIPKATLLIVGKHERKYEDVRGTVFAGVVNEELPYYFGSCDLYVTASLWESFNIPIVQAQMCGKKVVAFDVGSHPEVVKNGILVKEGDVKGFAEAVIKSLKFSRNKKSRHTVKVVQTNQQLHHI